MADWPKGATWWDDGELTFLSVPFTWDLPKAAEAAKKLDHQVIAGGPAVRLLPDYLPSKCSNVIACTGDLDALSRINPDATFTTRGCIRSCYFCAVPKTEGAFRELISWKAVPIICDNNFLASSRVHFDKVIDSLKGVKEVDFNQGLDVRLLTDYHCDRLAELDLKAVRFAWDHINEQDSLIDAITRCFKWGIPKSKIHVYCLIGYKDTPEDALFRLNVVRALGCTPNPMRFQPLDSVKKNSFVGDHWTPEGLQKYMRYWSRLRYFGGVPFEEWQSCKRKYLHI